MNETKTAAEVPAAGKHDREARQRALMDAAVGCFASRGYDAATTREVAESAGCAEGLIHRYFGGKRGLLMAILEAKAAETASAYDVGLPLQDAIIDEVEQLLLQPVEVMWQKRAFLRVAYSQAVIDPEIGSGPLSRLNAKRTGLVRERLRVHQEAGRIRDDIDLDAAAEMISWLSFSLGFMLQIVAGTDREELHRLARQAAEMITRGIQAAPEPPQHSGEPHNTTATEVSY
jgi:AcrR family transcriptional regulator